ncbi:MAG TPA: glycoside hydrolase family 9 protein, partial [Prolixibacteraceae bacterium]|nr:glycoside hydrolase family 9 protein [Prolixibacteraceae bacterium]
MKTSVKLASICLTLLIALPAFTMAQPAITKYITVDQFGYLPDSKKTAVIRNPQLGFDAEESFTPGTNYAVVRTSDTTIVFSGSPLSWKNGSTDSSSGDKAWWFNFSEFSEEGSYYILDVDSNLRSYEFEISEDVFEEVLIQAVRTFFYQRSGFAKETPFACEEWADGASHLQDKHARDFLDKADPATKRNVLGGWYDAGDYNKYTSWTANYVVEFMKAFLENPGVWGDDYTIPESGKQIPDILDEGKWGIDHLLRMQEPDGSMLSIVGAAHGSPPSTATGASYYGRPNTSSTLNSAGAFAIASKVYRSVGMGSYADSLLNSAIRAWDWEEQNPNVIFKNNSGSTSGLGAGQQETDDYGRLVAKLEAAVFLFEITADEKYKNYFESNYTKIHLMQWTFAFPFETDNQEILLYYTTLEGISSTVKSN